VAGRGLPPGRPRSFRLAIALWVGAFAAVCAGFAWVAVKSFEVIHPDHRGATLKAVDVTGQEETVFKWRRDRCEEIDIPDSPARAFRDADGTVHLIASHYVSRQATGPDLDHVRHRCQVIMRSDFNANPAAFDDREWIFAPYTPDGRTVFALVHTEYQGSTHPGKCASGVYERCWYNAVTLARSSDGGNSFVHAQPPPKDLVAAVPYRYTPDSGPYGIFQPSNIVKKDGYFYSLVSATRFGQQKLGTCVMRTQRLDDPRAWRAWNGSDFTVRFVDPYADHPVPRDHVCEPVLPDRIANMTFSLTYNTYFHKFLLVGPAGLYDPRARRVVNGFYYSLSDDLLDWDQRKLIREAVLLQDYKCGGPDPEYYPSVLDPGSDSPNFETTGRRPYLYFTHLHYKDCRQTFDRDLVRVRIEFSK
jgi:hypothetical protein